jgi:hypothetical protein
MPGYHLSVPTGQGLRPTWGLLYYRTLVPFPSAVGCGRFQEKKTKRWLAIIRFAVKVNFIFANFMRELSRTPTVSP